ncbi:MAG: tRNA (N(6)-L-threonylcarbamoyladenosine(37)-C(2))-methylthiotransferase MtaB [Acholeplasmatales bacterium]|nr:tRNA (N(6)-L-threonylcarbamoyladenosine(37)-C(2))-methylthiotransferase MtaB [Acholeplasmatales bacterium]
MKVGFITLGCKVNIYESNALKEALEDNGFEVKEASEDCDVFVINTCSVTNMADAKSRKMIRKCIKMNPNALICACGCYVQTNEEALSIEGVDILVGNGNKKEIVDKILEAINKPKKEKYVNIIDVLHMHTYEPLDVTSYDHTRAFVKIEDGCENFCSFCIIPFARGPVRCKNADKVIEELKNITLNGYKEVVLSGIHTGRYFDNGLNFSGLVERILKEVPLLKRLRVSSIEINEVDDHFIELMKNSKVIANHLHLPLQCGSDPVLKAMNRRYDLAFFTERVRKIREARPDISLTADVIVGFPTETDEEYLKSKAYCKEIGFSKIHVFPYSRRAHTKAALMPQVKDSIKKERALDLIKLSDELELEYANKFLGQTLDVIPEQKLNSKEMVGHTSNFLQVILPYDEKLIGEDISVVIDKIQNGKIYGKLI